MHTIISMNTIFLCARDLELKFAKAISPPIRLVQRSGGARRSRLVITDKLKTTSTDESQKDSGSKPKVARHELPWVNALQNPANPNGVAAASRPNPPQPRWGWRDFRRLTQGSSCLATLGWWTQSLWDCPQPLREMWIMTRRERRAPLAPNSCHSILRFSTTNLAPA